MLDLRIPEISSTSGPDSDGVVNGRVSQSELICSISNVQMSNVVYAYRKDTATGFSQFQDISTNAVSDVAFEPFGSTDNFSANDALILSCTEEVKEIFFRITTPGVFTCDGIDVLISTDGITFNTTLTGVTDNSNAFRNAAGIYRITLPNDTGHVDSSPVPGEITSRRWHLIKFRNLTGITTAPQINHIWLIHQDANMTYMDSTAVQNSSMTSNVFGTFDTTVFPTIGTTHYYAFPFLAYGMETAVFRKFITAMTRTTEYLSSDDTWKTLPDYVDPSNALTNGPTTLGETAITYSRRWTIPTDWASKTLSFPLDGGESVSYTGYFIRQPITSITTYGPLGRALWRARGRAFGSGNSNGIYHKTSTTYSYVTFTIGNPSSTDMVISFTNCITGQSRSINIPANSVDSGSLTGGRLDFSSPLTIGAGEHLLISHVSGSGVIQDMELHLDKS